MNHLTVKLFAGLKNFAPVQGLPGTPFDIELPDPCTLQDVVTHLNLPEDEVKITFVNGIIQEMDWVLKSGDEIGIFPPVGGG
jgi:sulfur-carrier protein